MSLQGEFTSALFDRSYTRLPEIFSSPSPASRFTIYRNNVFSSMLDALADSYPVVAQLVGEAFFNAMALTFVQAHPPRSRSLVDYGEDFAAFIETFTPAAGLPYLADVARLERLCVRAYHACDSQAVSLELLAELMAQPEELAELRLGLHPSLSILPSDYAVCSLWEAHQPGGDITKVDPCLPERALVLRCGLEVELLALDTGTCAFIQALQAGLPLGRAAHLEGHASSSFDLGQCLALLISKNVITQLLTEEKARP
ncbi:DNA-binding domain-containing protein [Pseudomonas akapageensis]|uniref:HvfC/BufC N-terminal domain-containing protein n=1 Tax=Pseudomonas akapageensis TaxID=2609961 RepID=UPI001409F2B5|nr:DNA-binding domain-containing protein [Pseudomonas akapageensis]